MRLSVWAELQGISYKTAWRMWKAKTLPVPAYQLATGTVVIEGDPAVSSREQRRWFEFSLRVLIKTLTPVMPATVKS